MTIDTNQFWNLLTASQLVPPSTITKLMAEVNSDKTLASTEAVAKWLNNRKTLTSYQTEILLAGHPGPFHYGSYTVRDRFKSGPLAGFFRARHRATQHPVLLEFFAGDNLDDLKKWTAAETTGDQASRIKSPQLVSVFESVPLPQYRFIVSSRPAGTTLNEMLPYKGRLDWQKSLPVFTQIAAALAMLHENEIAHGAVSPRNIWVSKSGAAQLRLALQPDSEFETLAPNVKGAESKFDYLAPELIDQLPSGSFSATPAADVYGLGCSILRAITGRPPFPSDSIESTLERHKKDPIADLKKFELPTELNHLMQTMLAKDPAQRPSDLNLVRTELEKLSGKSIASFTYPTPDTFAAYRDSIDRYKPGRIQPIESVPEVATDETSGAFPQLAASAAPKQLSAAVASKSLAATEAAARRKKNRWKTPAAVAGTLALFSAIIGIWAFSASRTVVSNTPVEPTPTTNIKGTDRAAENPTDNKPIDPVEQINAMSPEERPIVLQRLVDDSEDDLWETPTTGPPVDLSGLPPAPKLIFSFRPREIVSNPEGRRVIQSLGPEFRSLIEQWKIRCGLELDDVQQLIVSFHTTADFEYEPFFVVTTVQPLDINRLLQFWNRPEPAQSETDQTYFASTTSDTGFYLLHDPAASETAPDSISKFAFGSIPLIQEVANNAGETLLTGALSHLSTMTDRDRHFNFLYLRTALFNDEGQKLMGPRLRSFNRELSILIPDSVRGGLLSFHLDEGTYVEMIFDKTVDVKPMDLKTLLSDQLKKQRDRLTQFVADIPRSPYWNNVRVRYDNMLTDLFRNLRWDVEHDEVIANGWLPPMAAHNLLAATELVVSFSDGSAGSAPTHEKTGPQSIEELLAVKRDLKIANPPDLNLLMADIESEINEDYPGLPFEFQIRLLGSDLQKEGITKNQRPGELNMEQQTLAEILTQIMTSANPSKDISGPADTNCKLVWVIAENPEEPGKQTILITTRAAAKEKSYKLPPPFLQ